VSLPRVFIVLLNYNAANDTIECIKSLLKISYANYHILLVDNASVDGSVDNIIEGIRCVYDQKFDPIGVVDDDVSKILQSMKITIIQNKINAGYGCGNNVGIKYAQKKIADYVLIINNDTVVDENFLEPLVEMCEANKGIGIATAKIYFYDRRNVLWFNVGRFNRCTAKVEHFSFNETDVGQESLEENTFLSGCLWLMPTKLLDEVGLINEKYFMYVEDLDYSQRVINKGYSLRVCEKSKIWHKVGGSTGGRYSPFYVYWVAKNMNYYIGGYKKTNLCKFMAYFAFNLRFVIVLLREKKFFLLKKYFQAIRDCTKIGG